MSSRDISTDIQQQVEQARSSKSQVNICGGDSKRFYGRESFGEVLDVSEHNGVVNYEPTELVMTVRAGTQLSEVEHVLASENQMLAFEPPGYGKDATIGGTIACNFSGPRRAFAGSARDYVLGCSIINGKAERLHFGGEVMKNVAGYDVSRLMCGAMGTLGVLLEVSIKILPAPEVETTLMFEMDPEESLHKVNELAGQSLPISATCFDDSVLHIRLSGTEGALKSARQVLGGDLSPSDSGFWDQLKEHKLGYFGCANDLWRLSLPSSAPVLDLAGKYLYEWNGAQRWFVTETEDIETIRQTVAKHGGHATCFRQRRKHDNVFHPLDNGLLKIHQQLKYAFDPEAVFNPGRMYAGI
jgi:glycolate oxidase FAD binding subunit